MNIDDEQERHGHVCKTDEEVNIKEFEKNNTEEQSLCREVSDEFFPSRIIGPVMFS